MRAVSAPVHPDAQEAMQMKTDTGQMNPLLGWALTVMRVLLGIFWLAQQTWKPPPTFGCPSGGFCFWLDQEIQHPLVPLFADFLRAVIRPNAIAFGWFTLLVEVSIGLTLIFGVFTRLGALVATLWSLNLLIGLAAVPGETPWYYLAIVAVNLLFVVIGASGQFSVDRARHRRISGAAPRTAA
jgi:uncharacterized membrane protein YphA (DoxX/SURF4 family)